MKFFKEPDFKTIICIYLGPWDSQKQMNSFLSWIKLIWGTKKIFFLFPLYSFLKKLWIIINLMILVIGIRFNKNFLSQTSQQGAFTLLIVHGIFSMGEVKTCWKAICKVGKSFPLSSLQTRLDCHTIWALIADESQSALMWCLLCIIIRLVSATDLLFCWVGTSASYSVCLTYGRGFIWAKIPYPLPKIINLLYRTKSLFSIFHVLSYKKCI